MKYRKKPMNDETKKEIRKLVTRAIRLSIDDSNIIGFGFSTQHEKTILDNMDFLYWLIKLAKFDEREACAKLMESQLIWASPAQTIRARGEA